MSESGPGGISRIRGLALQSMNRLSARDREWGYPARTPRKYCAFRQSQCVADVGQLLHDLGDEIADVDPVDAQRGQQVEPIEVIEYDRQSRLRQVLFELK